MRFLTNALLSRVPDIERELLNGHEGKRIIDIREPHETYRYAAEDLKDRGYVGLYQIGTCDCDSCKGEREEKYYKPLNDWRKWNASRMEEANGNHS